jgi:hypothetical protein
MKYKLIIYHYKIIIKMNKWTSNKAVENQKIYKKKTIYKI